MPYRLKAVTIRTNNSEEGIRKIAELWKFCSSRIFKRWKSTLLFVYSSEIKYWEGYLKEAGSNAFTFSPLKWISTTNAVGLFVRLGRGGGTFAHKDIAFKFASWLSAEFELYIIKDYQRLKDDENSKLSLNWNLNREISKINYKIHTDAIKTYLLGNLTKEQLSYKYASEADMLNVALFNKRAKEWKEENPKLKVNI